MCSLHAGRGRRGAPPSMTFAVLSRERRLSCLPVDLGDFDSVRRCAAAFLARNLPAASADQQCRPCRRAVTSPRRASSSRSAPITWGTFCSPTCCWSASEPRRQRAHRHRVQPRSRCPASISTCFGNRPATTSGIREYGVEARQSAVQRGLGRRLANAASLPCAAQASSRLTSGASCRGRCARSSSCG